MKTNVINILRLFILILPFICLPIFIVMGVFNCIDTPHNPTVGYTVKSIGYSELNALNPTTQVDIVISEPEESNQSEEEISTESNFSEEVTESIDEESSEPDESEEPKHTMGVGSSNENSSGYFDVGLHYQHHPDFVYYPKYYDTRRETEYNIALSREYQDFAFSKCQEYGVPFELMMGLWGTEASWNVNIGVTRGTYYGIGQINIEYCEAYLKKYGVELCTPAGGLEGSIIIIRDKLVTYGGDVNKALMAYNHGDYGASLQWKKGVYCTEYTKKVLSIANNLKKEG